MENTFIFKEATLLSVNEAKKLLSIKDREYSNWWWLRSPGHYQYSAAIVNLDGSVYYPGYSVNIDYDCVRPALKINLESSGFKIEDTFSFGGKTFKIISDDLAFCLEDIGTHCFRKDWKAPDANDYEVSDVKRFVDAWFEAALKEEREV